MSNDNAYTRRHFMQNGLAMVSMASTVPMFIQDSALAMGANNTNLTGVPGDKILVVVQLAGGNDGLNTVVPYGLDDYYSLRPSLAISGTDALHFNDQSKIGLNPGMTGIRDLIDSGLGSVIQGVGYPNPNRSHFVSMDIWHTANPKINKGHGWLGKALDLSAVSTDGSIESTACICLGKNAPLAAQGQKIKPIAFENANLFKWSGSELGSDLDKAYEKINRKGSTQIASNDPLSFIKRTSLDALVASDQIRNAARKGTQTNFPSGNLSNQLRTVSSMIRAGMPTRVYYVGLGGFDTHANQTNRHQNLLSDFSRGIGAFYKELKALGLEKNVLTVAFSEFGRRVKQNGSRGTDHGTAGPMFMFGDMVNPGIHGKHPSLTKLDRGDLVHSTDFRSVYATILDQWLNVNSKTVLGKQYKNMKLFKKT